MDATRHILKTIDGKVSGDDNTATIAKGLGEEKDKPVVFWFHGGLTETKSGLEMANRVGPKLEEWGQFPVFVVWESGIGHTLQDAIGAFIIRKLGKRTIELVEGLVKLKLGDKALGIGLVEDGGLELTDLDERLIQEAVAADPEMRKEAQTLSGEKPVAFALEGSDVATPQDQAMNDHLQSALKAYTPNEKAFGAAPVWVLAIGKFVVDVARRTLARFRAGRDHGITQTIIEEAVRGLSIGADLWDEMKNDAKRTFDEGGAGRDLLRALKEGLQGRTIVLAGHSTGAIMIHHFLEAARAVGLAGPFHLRYLAPAIRFDLAKKTFEDNAAAIASVRIFSMGEASEHADKLFEGLPLVGQYPWVQGIYKGSLLYMVSGAFEARASAPLGDVPLLGMQRYIGASFLDPDEATGVQAVVDAIHALDQNAFVWTPTSPDALPGYRGISVSHGGFDDDTELVDAGAIASLIVIKGA